MFKLVLLKVVVYDWSKDYMYRYFMPVIMSGTLKKRRHLIMGHIMMGQSFIYLLCEFFLLIIANTHNATIHSGSKG